MPHNYPGIITYFNQKIKTKISLKKEFKEERQAMRALSSDHPDQVYLSGEKQSAHEIYYCQESNTFVDLNSDLLYGEYNFILTCEDRPRLICDPKLNHSFLANGEKVLAAGNLVFDNGVLVTLTNNSGHYRPTDNEMLAVIKAFYDATHGSMKTYKSYCTPQPCTYPVQELVDVEDFCDASPLQKNETINAITGHRICYTGYDEFGLSDAMENLSFYRRLPKETIAKYQAILQDKNRFFHGAGQLAVPSEEDAILNISPPSIVVI